MQPKWESLICFLKTETIGVLLTKLYLTQTSRKSTLWTEEKNNYVMSMALDIAPKCKSWTAEENEDWGIKVDAEKLEADQKTYEDSL